MKKSFHSFAFGALLSIALVLFAPLAIATSLTNTYENKVVDVVFRGQAFSESSPANYYVALYSSSCTDASPGTEISGGSYARVAVARSATAWKGTHGTASGASSGTSGTISNAAAITFPTPTANWGSVTAFGILDASSGGSQVVCNNLTTAKTVNNGDSAPLFPIGALTVQIDN
jgi:hypothetical protein